MRRVPGTNVWADEASRGLPSAALSWTRWLALGLLLLLSLTDPTVGRLGLPTWAIVLLFAGYNLAVDLIHRRRPEALGPAPLAALDLVAAGVAYLLGSEHGGTLYVLVFLAVVCAAATLPMRATLVATAAAAALLLAIEPTLRQRQPWPQDLRDLGGRLVILLLAGVGAAVLTHRLATEGDARRSIRNEAERLGELDRLRTTFIATVSHNLHTPLTAASVGVGMLEETARDRLQPDDQSLLANVQRNLGRLRRHIDDLLTFNLLRADALHLEAEPLDLRTAIAGAVAMVNPLIQQKDQELALDVPVPLIVVGDPRRLEQVFVNLLANAHRHTPPGTRIVLDGGVSSDRVEVVVSDDGPGIPPEEHAAIFERFHRLGPAEDGSGLGLPIAKAITELHGGRLWVESTSGCGTAFHVALPRFQSGDDA